MSRLVVFAVAACGTSAPAPSAHESAACNQVGWAIPQKLVSCEAACTTKPVQNGPACGATCSSTFEYDGQQGCCVLSYSEATVPPNSTIVPFVATATFAECR